MVKIVSVESVKERNKQRQFASEMNARINGAITKFKVQHNNGVIDNFPNITKEIITSTGANALAERMLFNMDIGRQAVPRLYEDIYRVVTDPTAPPYINFKDNVLGRVIFFEKTEGGEVVFGGAEGTDHPTRMRTFSGGLEHTREFRIFTDENLFAANSEEEAFGEGNNAILNHIHLSPIINFDYGAGNKVAAITSEGRYDLNLRRTLEQAVSVSHELNNLGGEFTILLANPADRLSIERVIQPMQSDGSSFPAIDQLLTIVYYRGWSGTGIKGYSVSYPGVPRGKAYLIRGQRAFGSVIKEDMVLEMGDGDVSRGIDKEIVAYTTLATYAGVEDNVIEITLPS